MSPELLVTLCLSLQAVQIINDYLLFCTMLWLVMMKVPRDFVTKLCRRETCPRVGGGDPKEMTVASFQWAVRREPLFSSQTANFIKIIKSRA